MKDKIKRIEYIIKILVGLFIIGTAFYGYHYKPQYMYELTFISNFISGLLLLTDGILNLFLTKKLPVMFYQFVLPCTNTVFFTVVFKLLGLHDFNFDGAFFFMHAINPVVFFILFLFGTELKWKGKRDSVIRIFLSPIMIMAYVLFDFIRYTITGEFVYGLIPTNKITVVSTVLIGIGLYLLMMFMSYGILELKKYVQACLQKSKGGNGSIETGRGNY